MDLGNTGNMQMEKVNSKAQIAGTTYEYLDHIGEPIPILNCKIKWATRPRKWPRFILLMFQGQLS